MSRSAGQRIGQAAGPFEPGTGSADDARPAGLPGRRARRLGAIGAAVPRFAMGVSGPVAIAGANAVLQFATLRTLPASAFGLLAFVLGLVQFGFGLSNALLGVPYTVDIQGNGSAAALVSTYFKVNLLLALAWGGVTAAAALYLGGAWQADAALGLFSTLAMLRWFGRSHLYAIGQVRTAVWSDVGYAIVLCLGAILASPSLAAAALVLAAATVVSMGLAGLPLLALQFHRARQGRLREYGRVWREQARWALLGVVSTEATSNAHAYVVSAYAGPVAFAPIAAAALLIKPILLVITSLTQLERPAMVRAIAAGDPAGALRTVGLFRVAVVLTWVATTLLAVALLVRFPTLLAKGTYDGRTLAAAFALWSGIALVQCWSTPPNVLLQAARRFRSLAGLQAGTGVLTVCAVILGVIVLPPIYSLGGVLVGQIVMAARIDALAKRWFAGATPAGDPAPVSPAPVSLAP